MPIEVQYMRDGEMAVVVSWVPGLEGSEGAVVQRYQQNLVFIGRPAGGGLAGQLISVNDVLYRECLVEKINRGEELLCTGELGAEVEVRDLADGDVAAGVEGEGYFSRGKVFQRFGDHLVTVGRDWGEGNDNFFPRREGDTLGSRIVRLLPASAISLRSRQLTP